MSVNIIKNFIEGKQVKLTNNISIGFEFMERLENFSLIKRLLMNNIDENKYYIFFLFKKNCSF